MVCAFEFQEKPELDDPVLLEGLPGIGLVANIAVAHLLRKLDTKFLGDIHSSFFQDIAITNGKGSFSSPRGQFYYCEGKKEGERDLILFYGNTQALTSQGQYELCACTLDAAESLGCRYVITLGGYRPGRKVLSPKLYFAASDLETARTAASLGAEALGGEIFGMAGLLVGLCGLRGMKGFCLLAETPGTYPDKEAAGEVIKAISRILGWKIDVSDLTESMEFGDIMAPFDFGALTQKPKRESEPSWFV